MPVNIQDTDEKCEFIIKHYEFSCQNTVKKLCVRKQQKILCNDAENSGKNFTGASVTGGRGSKKWQKLRYVI